MEKRRNLYIAIEPKYGTAMYSGIAESEERFVEQCQERGFDLTGLEIELIKKNPCDELGRLYEEHVRKDLGTI